MSESVDIECDACGSVRSEEVDIENTVFQCFCDECGNEFEVYRSNGSII